MHMRLDERRNCDSIVAINDRHALLGLQPGTNRGDPAILDQNARRRSCIGADIGQEQIGHGTSQN